MVKHGGVQNCVMLKGAKGFETQSNDNKVFTPPYAACKSADGKRWVITAREPHQRAWGNEKCPCLHSDPRIPDCAPGETQRLRNRRPRNSGRRSCQELPQTLIVRSKLADAICLLLDEMATP
jgi:hypothetical protein